MLQVALISDKSIKCMLVIVFLYFLSPSGKGILSGHADGSIIRYFFDDEGSGDAQVIHIIALGLFLCMHPKNQTGLILVYLFCIIKAHRQMIIHYI